MAPLVKSARAGHIELLWSPAIIAEASRVLLWIWLQKRNGVMTEALKRESFDIARRWFEVMSSVFKVVEDRPPYAPQWTDSPRDENDRPLWTAAVNAGAQVVVTENLRDGHPDLRVDKKRPRRGPAGGTSAGVGCCVHATDHGRPTPALVPAGGVPEPGSSERSPV
jgi:predicted nucleic acid-binding protein